MSVTDRQARQVRNFRMASMVIVPGYLLVVFGAVSAGASLSSAPLVFGGVFAVAAQSVALLRRDETVARLIPPVLVLAVLAVYLDVSLFTSARALAVTPVFGLLAVSTPFVADRSTEALVALLSAVALGVALIGDGVGLLAVAAQVASFLLLWAVVSWLSRQQSVVLAEEEIARAEARELTDLVVSASVLNTTDLDEVMDRLVAAANDLGFAPVTVTGPKLSRDRADEVADGIDADAIVAEHHELDTSRRGVALHELEDGRAAAVGRLSSGDRDFGHIVAVAPRGQQLTAARMRTFGTLTTLAGQAMDGASRYSDQQRIVRRLVELDLAKLDFISSVSHELRTPLTVIKGLGDTLATGRVQLDSTAGQQLVGRLTANAERLGRMVANLLDMSRLYQEGIEIEQRAIRLGDVVLSVCDRLQDLSAVHDLRCELTVDPTVLADGLLLEHVLENLVSNAVKHTPAGTTVTLRIDRRENEAVVYVEDDGPGIPADDLPKLTERFFRGGDPMTRETSGLGLGLALVADILLAHGSRLQVTSREGQGSSFSFALEVLDG